jgi:hypothetical protein
MKRPDTLFERCIITQFLRSLTDEELSAMCEPHWTDWGLPTLMLCVAIGVLAFMHYFPNGIWSLS